MPTNVRIALHQLFLLVAGVLLPLLVSGQGGGADLDSIAVIPFKSNSVFKFSDRGAKEIKLSHTEPRLEKNKAGALFRDMGNGALTVFTGIGFSSSGKANWKFTGTIKSNDSLPDWNINLFCEGYNEKEKERVQNDDGSWSVETDEKQWYYWDKNATGIITEGRDTIGVFLIVMYPREDEFLKPLADDILVNQRVQQKTTPNNIFGIPIDPLPGLTYGIRGIFRGQDFSIISNGNDGKRWIFSDSVFNSVFEAGPEYSMNTKKNVFIPYILIDNNAPFRDRRDLFRLSIMSVYLSHSLR